MPPAVMHGPCQAEQFTPLAVECEPVVGVVGKLRDLRQPGTCARSGFRGLSCRLIGLAGALDGAAPGMQGHPCSRAISIKLHL
jgi:hypothetical protein